MRIVLLGSPKGVSANRWKDDIAESADALGWPCEHIEARGIPTDRVVAECKGADLFIWAREHNRDPDGDAYAMLREIENMGIPTVGVHMDLYWGINIREPRVGSIDQPWWSCQYVFTADGGNQDRFSERGVNHLWMAPAMGVRFFGRHEPTPRSGRLFASFLGSNVRQIHTSHRYDLVTWASKRYGKQFKHFGLAKKLYGSAINQMCSTTRFVLGDSAPAPFYWSDRVPNIMGRGGLLAYPRTPGLQELGFDESNMLLYDRYKFEELGDRMDSMSDRDVAEMSEAGLELVASRHMWKHRLMEIERIVF